MGYFAFLINLTFVIKGLTNAVPATLCLLSRYNFRFQV